MAIVPGSYCARLRIVLKRHFCFSFPVEWCNLFAFPEVPGKINYLYA
jgi:hypothetical protein